MIENVLTRFRKGDHLEGMRLLESLIQNSGEPLVTLNWALLDPHGEAQHDLIEQSIQSHTLLLDKIDVAGQAVILYNLGCFALFQEDVLTAKLRFSEAARLNPSFPAAFHNLAFTHELMAEIEEAEENYRKALELDPEGGLSRINLARVHRLIGRTDEAHAELSEVLTADPGNRGALLSLCRMLLSGGETSGAEETLSLLEGHEGWEAFPELRECRAYALFQLGEYEAAEQEFRALLDLDEANYFSRMGLMNVLAVWGNHQQLLEQAEILQGDHPTPEMEELISTLKGG